MSDFQDEDLLEEADDDIVSHRSSSHARSGWGRPRVIAAVLVGIVLGVWMAGKPSAEPVPVTTDEPAAAAQATVDPLVRKAELEARIAQHPDDADAHLELGVILFNEDDTEGAKAEWTTVTELDPASQRAWYNLGFYYLYQDPPDYDSARAVWNTVIQLDPDSDLAQTVLTHIGGLPESSETSETGQ